MPRLRVPQEVLDVLPRLYANDQTQTPISAIIIHLHLFVASFDWWIAEYDGDDLFFGFVNLGDDVCAEWGYISRAELEQLTTFIRLVRVDVGLSAEASAKADELIRLMPLPVEWDEHWEPKPFREVEWRKWP